MNALYNVVGITKQAVHQYQKRHLHFDGKVKDLLIEAQELQKEHPVCDVEKMLIRRGTIKRLKENIFIIGILQVYKELKKYVEKAVHQYNHKRVHNNLGKLSPIDFETMWFNNSLKNKPTCFNYF